MTNIFQGDPRMTLGKNGASLEFVGGQPVMDQGLENQAIIALFTGNGWAGNTLFADPNKKAGSDFEKSTRKAITITSLNDMRDAAEKALESPIFGDVTVSVTNPKSNRLDFIIEIKSPGGDLKTLLLTRNGQNWISQSENPAYRRLSNGS
jgi:phage gp46-like protein